MTLKINISIDIEDAVRQALEAYMDEAVYCLPLPEALEVPCVAITCSGIDSINTVDTFQISLDSRAELEADAFELLRRAVGILVAIGEQSNTPIVTVQTNSMFAWGQDPDRPDLALCGATLLVTAHQITVDIEEGS